MKTGRSIIDLASELERQLTTKKDFKSPTGLVTMRNHRLLTPNNTISNAIVLEIGDEKGRKFEGGVTRRGHQQIGQNAGIPAKYYDRMLTQAPELLATNVNRWFHERDGENKTPTHLFRTMDGDLRAMLSNRYRTLDNHDIAQAVLPTLVDAKVQIVSADVTEDWLYIKAVSPKLEFEVKKGDVVQMGIVISNSEVGLGAVRIEPLLYRLACLNGAIMEDQRVRKFHIGRAAEELENAIDVYTDATRKADDKAFMMKLHDAVKAAFDEARFKQIAETTKLSEERLIPGKADVQEVIEVVAGRFGFSEGDRAAVLNNLVRGGSLSQWALANAVTLAANTEPSYERATHLERTGGNIISMDDVAWKRLVTEKPRLRRAA